MNIIKGDLLKLADKGMFDVIVHGCNCFHTMGASIAYQIAKKYPHIYEIDKQTNFGSKGKLGTYTFGTCIAKKSNPPKFFTIINAYTQYSYSTQKPQFEYKAFEKILGDIGEDFNYVNSIGFPLIGCRLAGGDKNTVLSMIEEFSKHFNGEVTVVEYN